MSDPDLLWGCPENWTLLGYRCKEDPRVIVPKRNPAMGWTMNWAHPWAVPSLLALFALAMVPVLAIVGLGTSQATSPFAAVVAAFVAVPLSIVLVVSFCRYASSVR